MISLLASIPSPSQNTIDIGPLSIHFYGILIAVGILVAVFVSKIRYGRFGGDPDTLERVAIWAVVAGLLGARLGYVITHSGTFSGRPWAVLFIWEGGLVLYGGLTAGVLTAVYLLNRRHGDVFAAMDAVAVGIPIAQAIGRWGNYFNQELFGTPSTLPWALEIDVANRPAEYLQFETFHPTFLYEALWNLLLTIPIILWLERKGKLSKGASAAVYLIVYGTGRFLLELLRTDTTFRLLGISRNGWVSVGAVLFGIALLYWFQKRAEPRTLVGPPTFLAPGEETESRVASDETRDPSPGEAKNEKSSPKRE
jgi:prolipoprotein diacylglyceryl transferase